MFFVCRSRVVHRIKPVACVIVDHCYGCYCTGAAEAAGGCVMVQCKFCEHGKRGTSGREELKIVSKIANIQT